MLYEVDQASGGKHLMCGDTLPNYYRPVRINSVDVFATLSTLIHGFFKFNLIGLIVSWAGHCRRGRYKFPLA